jgi:putative FmdB family regulatory protein
MPIYEFYCPEHHKIYQFFAKTLAQGKTMPKCPENPRHALRKLVSSFAVTRGGKSAGEPGEATATPDAGEPSAGDTRMEAALGAMENELAGLDENDPRAMGRMMRRMAELTGEKIEGEVEEVVRKLEEGADPDALEEQLGGENPCSMPDPDEAPAEGEKPSTGEKKEARARFRVRRPAPVRDPKLYDYE